MGFQLLLLQYTTYFQVNYTNRNAESAISESQLGIAYVSATFSALGTAIGLKKFLEMNAPKMMQRFVPLCAVGSANCVRWFFS